MNSVGDIFSEIKSFYSQVFLLDKQSFDLEGVRDMFDRLREVKLKTARTSW